MALQGRRVLVVEDEYFIASAVESALIRENALVIGPVPTVDLALTMIERAKQIDAAVIDINLQGNMSFSVADALTARGVPFVFITGYDRQVIPPRHRNVPVWQKPFEVEDLIQALPALVRQ